MTNGGGNGFKIRPHLKRHQHGKEGNQQEEESPSSLISLVHRIWLRPPSNDSKDVPNDFPNHLVAAVPRMPRAKAGPQQAHREKEVISLPQCPIAVSRQLTKKEYAHDAAAQKAIQAEAKKLRDKKLGWRTKSGSGRM